MKSLDNFLKVSLLLSGIFMGACDDSKEKDKRLYDNSRIAFTSNREGNQEIYTIYPNREHLRRRTYTLKSEGAPTWSADGRRVAYMAKVDEGVDIFVKDLFSKNEPKNITNSPGHDSFPSWSKANDMIVFTSDRDDLLNLYATDPEGESVLYITSSVVGRITPSWSPDGRSVVFGQYFDHNVDICTLNFSEGMIKTLTSDPADDKNPSWSPDGKKIAFDSKRNGNSDIYVMNSDGTNIKRLTDHKAEDLYPSWSPDSRMIAFQTNRGGNFDIFIMDADGQNQRYVTFDDADDIAPDWSGFGD